ncbi:flagellar basal-body rod protein FlgF [Afipia broomeae]|uniref:Flagellar basal-body rod protein FlgF n=1 Tax=Afipia broomeae ATCC 49717 TaxID=883078 RepID=K8P496_9BRAD|nr:flagellar basal-body rod protein FlgF [Afipia broomeae]EKS34505.1 flagellar hook-basal body protein [Afipia broomeae ATCC 49717]
MGETTLIHLSRLIGLQRKLDVTAQNVANVDTNGFRARELSFREYLKPGHGVDESGKQERPLSLPDPRFVFTHGAQGPVQATGNPLDLAIDGDAYFVVMTEQGERYTRNGAFVTDARGRLVTEDGHPVLGRDGALQPSDKNDPISIGPDGVVGTKQRVLGRLRLVRFERPQFLQPVGASLLRSEEKPAPASTSKIVSGAIEKSNVQSAREMMRLTEITRAYEMVGSLLKNSQDADDINKLANVPD